MQQADFNSGTNIVVIGVGGAGSNAVEHMITANIAGVSFVVANTDAQALERSSAPTKIRLGTSGLGAGAQPDKGQEAARLQRAEIRAKLEGANLVFITAGMGGGTGTGAAPVVAEVARELGILTVGVVTKPFAFEGMKRMRSAEAGIKALSQHVDSLIVILNDKLQEVMGDDAGVEDCFRTADDVLTNAVGGISEIITYPGLINVDFEDVRTVMSAMGRAMMGSAFATGPERAREAAEKALASPLLEGANLSGAKGILVNITAAKSSFKMREVTEVMDLIQSVAQAHDDDAHIIFGAVYDDNMGDALRVTVVATGLGSAKEPVQQDYDRQNFERPFNPAPISPALLRERSAVNPLENQYAHFDAPAIVRRRGMPAR